MIWLGHPVEEKVRIDPVGNKSDRVRGYTDGLIFDLNSLY